MRHCLYNSVFESGQCESPAFEFEDYLIKAAFPIFLSVVFVVRNQADQIAHMLEEATKCISSIVSDYEHINVDNASTDASLSALKQLASEDGLPNLQVYALTKEVDADTASWVGLENAIG